MSDLQTVFNAARQRILAGEQLSVTEQRELITQLRGARFGAAETSTAAKTRKSAAKATGISDDELAGDLASLGL
jgi:uncharacterized membrane protein